MTKMDFLSDQLNNLKLNDNQERRGRVNKRPMKRRRGLSNNSNQSNGVSNKKNNQIRALREKVERRDKTITGLKQSLISQKDDILRQVRQREIEQSREIRKLETKLRNAEKKHEEFKRRKGQRHRTIVYRNKYKHYEHPKEVRDFEKTLLDIRNQPELNIRIFERFTKVLEVLQEHNKITKGVLQISHYLLLLNTYHLKGNLKGITAPSVVIPSMSQHQVRKGLNYLVKMGLVSKVTRIAYRINLMGEELLNTVNERMSEKSSIIENVKKQRGYFKGE